MTLQPTLPSEATPFKTILVVEDEDSVLKLVGAVLGREGYRVVTVSDPLAALDVLQGSTGLNLLLVDLVMPIMDGIALAARAAECRPHMPVLFMSGWHTDARLDEVLVQGLPLLRKPFSPAELIQSVRAAM